MVSSENIFKIELLGFAERLDGEHEREEVEMK